MVALLSAVLLFDGYVFLFYVEDVDRSVEAGDAGTLPDIKKPVLTEARQILARRAERMKNLGADLPTRNPFLEK